MGPGKSQCSGRTVPAQLWVRWAKAPLGVLQPSMLCFPTVLQEGTGASVGTQQVAEQEAQEGECKGHGRVQSRWASHCSSPGELASVMTGLSRVSDAEQKIFMQESDASNFLKKRDKRSPKSRDEANGKDAGDLHLTPTSHSFLTVSWALGTAKGAQREGST